MRPFLESDPPLTQLRLLCRVTQEALAAASGVARSTIASIESHRSVPTFRTCSRLGAAFSLSGREMIEVLSGETRVASLAHRVKWLGPAADVMPNVDTNDPAAHVEAIDHALMSLVHGHRPALRELDTVRRWLGEIGPAEVIGRRLVTDPEEWVLVVKLLLRLAKERDAASLDGALALWVLVGRRVRELTES